MKIKTSRPYSGVIYDSNGPYWSKKIKYQIYLNLPKRDCIQDTLDFRKNIIQVMNI